MNKNYKKLRYSLLFTALTGDIILWLLYPPIKALSAGLLLVPASYFIDLNLIKVVFNGVILFECTRMICYSFIPSWNFRKHLLFVLPVISLLLIFEITYGLPKSAFNHGWSLDDKGNYKEAIKYLDIAIRLNPKDANAYGERGYANNRMGNYEIAGDDYAKAIHMNPQNFESYIGRGNAFYYMSNYATAVADYSKAIQLNPKSAKGYADRGNVYYSMQNYKKALLDWKQAVAIDPSLEKNFKKWIDDATERNNKMKDVDYLKDQATGG